MENTELWITHLEKLIEENKNYIISDLDFKNSILSLISKTDCPFSAIKIQYKRNPPFVDKSFGDNGVGDPSETKTKVLGDPDKTMCTLSLWQNILKSDIDTPPIVVKLFQLCDVFWKSTFRNNISKLISYQKIEPIILQNTIVRLSNKNPFFSFVYADLDKFKRVNDEMNHAKGDEVILHFAAILEKTVPLKCNIIHRSGDEFYIFIPSENIVELIHITHSIYKEIDDYDFKTDKIKISTTFGIKTLRKNETINIQELQDDAEKATKNELGEKIRGKTRFFQAKTATYPSVNDFQRKIAMSLFKSKLNYYEPFNNVWLNFIHIVISQLYSVSSPEVMENETNDIIGWIAPEFLIDKIVTCSESEIDLIPKFSVFDLAISISCGIYNSFYRKLNAEIIGGIEIHFDKENSAFKLLSKQDSKMLFHFGKIEESKSTIYDLGDFLTSEGENIDSSLALLIKIGHFPLNIPKGLFSDIVTVDDRPTIGGGLPDLWEATIARLISIINTNQNIRIVFVLGKHEHGKMTIQYLNDVRNWDKYSEKISVRTGFPAQQIIFASKRLIDIIKLPKNEEELINDLFEEIKTHYHFSEIKTNTILHERVLDLEANINSMWLNKEDGIRVDTIAQAFPKILDIARKSKQNPIKDQAGQNLKELIDFKVLLLSPMKDKIPFFYLDEKDSLEEYFKREFISEKGLFGSNFNENGQLDAVVEHLATAIKNSENQFATRRAILVIPHKVKKEDIAPLGLISVRIIPRFEHYRIKLSFSYTWRTVEVLVGFPYSIYGSVSYSEYLAKLIKDKVGENIANKIVIGEVSYIAHSLHIFMDDFGQNIARSIVFAASN